MVTVASGVAATQIETSFSQDDFIPEDSEPGMVLDKVDRLFGGDLTEQTYVIVDGDLTAPEAIDALERAQVDLTETGYVRSAGGEADVISPLSLLGRLSAQDPAFAGPAGDLGFDPVRGLADDADVEALFELAREAAPDFSAQVIGDDVQDRGLRRLRSVRRSREDGGGGERQQPRHRGEERAETLSCRCSAAAPGALHRSSGNSGRAG